jgi:hypothetical protein
MSNSRRRKLEALRNKAMGPRSSKREKLKTVLKKKLVAKYGKKWMDVIAEEVDRFITATMDKKLAEKDLAQLENKIREKCRVVDSQRGSARPTGRTGRTGTGRSQASARPSARPSARGTARSVVPETPKDRAKESARLGSTTSAASDVGADEWTLLDAFDAMMNEQKVKNDRYRYREEQAQLKAELDVQVAIKEEAAAKFKKQEDAYINDILEEVAADKVEKAAKAKKQKDAMMKIKEAREKTIAIERARKKKSREENLKREIREIEDAQEEERQKVLRARRKRARALKEAARVRKENEAVRLRKEAKEEADRLEDIRLQEEFAARELKKESDRKAYFDKCAADQARRQAANVESRKEEFDNDAADLERIERHAREQEERSHKIAEETRIRRLKELEERNKILKRQVDEKRQREVDRRSRDLKYVIKAREDVKNYDERQRSEKRMKRQKQLDYQSMLQRQMSSGGDGTLDKSGPTAMTAGERELNREKLQKIHSDPQLMETLLGRIKYGSPGRKKRLEEVDEDDDL